MLVVDVFRPVNRRVTVGMIAFGGFLGLAIVRISLLMPNPLQCIALLFTASLVLGGVAADEISAAYRVKFSAGVPMSKESNIISPQYFGKVARRHFVNFTGALFVPVALGLLGRAIWRFL